MQLQKNYEFEFYANKCLSKFSFVYFKTYLVSKLLTPHLVTEVTPVI